MNQTVTFSGPNASEVMAFVQRAVRDPEPCLAEADALFHDHGSDYRWCANFVADIASSSEATRGSGLGDYILTEAMLASAEREDMLPLDPAWIADAVLPAARAVMLRSLLVHRDGDSRRAYIMLTAPFRWAPIPD